MWAVRSLLQDSAKEFHQVINILETHPCYRQHLNLLRCWGTWGVGNLVRIMAADKDLLSNETKDPKRRPKHKGISMLLDPNYNIWVAANRFLYGLPGSGEGRSFNVSPCELEVANKSHICCCLELLCVCGLCRAVAQNKPCNSPRFRLHPHWQQSGHHHQCPDRCVSGSSCQKYDIAL